MDERTESPHEIIEHVSWCKNFLRTDSGYFFLFPEPSTITAFAKLVSSKMFETDQINYWKPVFTVPAYSNALIIN